MADVVHLAHSLNFGGVETHLQLIAEQGGLRYRHRFLALAGGGSAERSIRAAGAEVETLGLDPWGQPLHAARALLCWVRREKPLVVHGHGADPNIFGLWPARLAGVPVRIGEEIGRSSESVRARLALRSAYLAANRVIAISEDVRAHIVRLNEAPKSKIVVLQNPIRHAPCLARPRVQGEPLRVGFLGRLESVKNCGALVEAVISLVAEGRPVELQVIGDGSERRALEARVRGASTSQAIHFEGFNPSPWEQLAACHLYVQPSISEGFGIAVAEAMSANLPAIVTAGGMSELIENGVTGWLIEQPTPEILARAIAFAEAMDGTVLARMGEAARRSIANRFAPSTYLAKLETLYDRLRGVA